MPTAHARCPALSRTNLTPHSTAQLSQPGACDDTNEGLVRRTPHDDALHHHPLSDARARSAHAHAHTRALANTRGAHTPLHVLPRSGERTGRFFSAKACTQETHTRPHRTGGAWQLAPSFISGLTVRNCPCALCPQPPLLSARSLSRDGARHARPPGSLCSPCAAHPSAALARRRRPPPLSNRLTEGRPPLRIASEAWRGDSGRGSKRQRRVWRELQ